jgi:FkbM family methyltransferase
VFREIITKEEYSFGLPSSAREIVDAGVNIGLVSLFYAGKFPHARILAIEPEPSNFALLQKNVRGCRNITPIQAALWHSETAISVSNPTAEYWAFAVSGDPGTVRAITIPSLMRDYGIEYIDLLKLDIEGAEVEVFDRCQWQGRVGRVVIELHDRLKPGCTATVDRSLAGFSKTTSGELTCYQGT